jgi:ABC-type transport system involved in cytochrome bd biosynthesis fused ATPase/permease subunit
VVKFIVQAILKLVLYRTATTVIFVLLQLISYSGYFTVAAAITPLQCATLKYQFPSYTVANHYPAKLLLSQYIKIKIGSERAYTL